MSVQLVSLPKPTVGESDLVRKIETQLETAMCRESLQKTIFRIRDCLKSSTINNEERDSLSKLRQKAYRKKRTFPVASDAFSEKENEQQLDPRSQPALQKQPVGQTRSSMEDAPMKLATAKHVPTLEQTPFWQGVSNYFRAIDGELWIRSLVRTIPLAGGAGIAGILLWMQSVSLYESSGFQDPEIVAFGGLAMIIGFAALYAMRGGILALACCLYMAGYETYFIASGTVSDDLAVKPAEVEMDETLA